MRTGLYLGLFGLALSACGGGEAPVLVGQIDSDSLTSGLRAADAKPHKNKKKIRFTINGGTRDVLVDSQGRFTVERLPLGDISFGVHSEDISGTITLHDVAPGELIEISVTLKSNEIRIKIDRREPRAPRHGGTLELRGHDQVHELAPGVHDGDLIIVGDRVTVKGTGGCGDRITTFTGNLTITGHDVKISNVEIGGRTEIVGDRVKLEGCY